MPFEIQNMTFRVCPCCGSYIGQFHDAKCPVVDHTGHSLYEGMSAEEIKATMALGQHGD